MKPLAIICSYRKEQPVKKNDREEITKNLSKAIARIDGLSEKEYEIVVDGSELNDGLVYTVFDGNDFYKFESETEARTFFSNTYSQRKSKRSYKK